MCLSGKNILIGLSGGIACYKVCDLIRLLIKSNANVTTILTKSASEFITPLSLQTLTKNKVYQDLFNLDYEYNVSHISLADKADLTIIVPATANIIGKISNGIADDLLTTVVMATNSQVMIAPAMNVNMWNNSIVQENISRLVKKGYQFIEPATGELACGYTGVGRLADIDYIFGEVVKYINPSGTLKNRKVLITLGGTKEYIDPVRCITNSSSGKMGLALINQAKSMGAEITAVSTVDVDIPDISVIRVTSAAEMLNATVDNFVNSDILIMAAAVSDFRPLFYSESKLKKTPNNDKYTLDMIKNPDILTEVSKIKQETQIVVGFAAETNDLMSNAKTKLISKKLDFIVANDVSRSDIAINSDYNEVTILCKSGEIIKISKDNKNMIAKKILETIASTSHKPEEHLFD